MYDEQVKRLRETSCGAENTLWWQAADTIEKLSKLADAIPHVCECCIGCEMEKKNGGCDNAFVLSPKRAMQYLIKPRWIPVTERLPEEWWPVLGLIQYHDEKEPPAQQVLWYLGNGHWCEVWRGDMIESDVTHWMPLPEPPKEET